MTIRELNINGRLLSVDFTINQHALKTKRPTIYINRVTEATGRHSVPTIRYEQNTSGGVTYANGISGAQLKTIRERLAKSESEGVNDGQ